MSEETHLWRWTEQAPEAAGDFVEGRAARAEPGGESAQPGRGGATGGGGRVRDRGDGAAGEHVAPNGLEVRHGSRREILVGRERARAAVSDPGVHFCVGPAEMGVGRPFDRRVGALVGEDLQRREEAAADEGMESEEVKRLPGREEGMQVADVVQGGVISHAQRSIMEEDVKREHQELQPVSTHAPEVGGASGAETAGTGDVGGSSGREDRDTNDMDDDEVIVVADTEEDAQRGTKRDRDSVDSEEIIIVGDNMAGPQSAEVKEEGNGWSVANTFASSSSTAVANAASLEQLQIDVQRATETVRHRDRLYKEAVAELRALEAALDQKRMELQEVADAAFDWDQASFPWGDILTRELRDVFRIQAFRPLQREALNATLLRRDVFAILPTGAGKSLLYQLAAVVDKGLTLVVTPLLSLSMDQKSALHALNIRAESLDSTTPTDVRQAIYHSVLPRNGDIAESTCPRKRRRRTTGLQDVECGNEWRQDDMETTILFVTPEQVVRSGRLMGRLESMYEAGHLSRIVIDEAHCCSHWGHDFRADYRKLGILKRQCPDTPVIALSATANEETVTDVRKILEIPECVVFRGSIDRPNLFYEVRKKKDDDEGVVVDIAFMCLNEFKEQCGIVYVLSRKEAEDFSHRLLAMDIAAGCYHGDMQREERDAVQEGWQSGELQVVVATTAFGLGIDNQKVRFVIHATMATSLEAYYQESGRAGRNGMPARCVLMHRPKDYSRMSNFVGDKGLARLHKMYDMYRYASGRGIAGEVDKRATCRRTVIAAAFNEVPPSRTPQQKRRCCDLCAGAVIPSAEPPTAVVDVTAQCQSILRILRRQLVQKPDEKLTLLAVATMWAARGAKARSFRGNERALDKEFVLNVRVEILIGLVFCKALREYHRHNAHGTNSYVEAGVNARWAEGGRRFEVVLHAEDAKVFAEK